jgi:hypothetical protein
VAIQDLVRRSQSARSKGAEIANWRSIVSTSAGPRAPKPDAVGPTGNRGEEADQIRPHGAQQRPQRRTR